MVYGRLDNVCLYFNVHALEQVTEYKYLGNIVKSVERTTNDVFADNYEYLCKAVEASSQFLRRQKTLGPCHQKSGYTYLIVWLDPCLYMDASYGVLELTAGNRWIKFIWCISGQSWGLKPIH